MIKNILLVATVFVASIVTESLAQTTIIAGKGAKGYTGDGGPATAATFNGNSGIWLDSTGNLYICDRGNSCVRKVDKSGIIRTIAGNATGGDGIPATAASLGYPQGIVGDKAGNIFIVDEYDHKVRKIDAAGIITTFVGIGTRGFSGDGGPATAAQLSDPSAISIDESGNLYVCDKGNNRIRKVNTAGIISTVAGDGTAGFSGDGGPAIFAQLKAPKSVSVDHFGNIYISDFDNSRIRKINTSGVIATIAGTGVSGYSGDGGPSTAANIGMTWGSTYPDGHGNLYIADYLNDCVRKIDIHGIITTIASIGRPAFVFAMDTNLYVSDQSSNVIRMMSGVVPAGFISGKMTVRANRWCNGPELIVTTGSYSTGMTVTTDFGDATTDVSPVLTGYTSGGYAIVNHTYNAPGTYTITQVLYQGGVPLDTLVTPYTYNFCRTLPVKLYYDENTNGAIDAGEYSMNLPCTAQVDSNGINIGAISAIAGFNYNAYAPPGTVYSFKLISVPDSWKVTVPATGTITYTLSTAVAAYPDNFFGLACPTTTDFDFGVKAVVPVTGVQDQWGHIYVDNKGSDKSGAMLTMTFSPKWNLDASSGRSLPATVTENSVTWTLGAMAANVRKDIYFVLTSNPKTGPLKIGDTVISSFTVLPGDKKPLDNTEIRIDTVRAGCDPNAIYVSPNGCVPKGTTNLEYTITFENTGNDTAHNIYVLDTLSDNLDPQSLRMVMSSANMNFGFLKDGGYTIAKFDFPNIKLLDSSYHDLCHGTLIYTIDMKKGLAADTRIYNRAGIYFDVNEVVLTNTSENIIGCPPLAIVMPVEKASASVFPNPTPDELTITTEKQYSSFTITNSIGQVMMEQPINGTQTKVSVKTLSAGLYYISLRGSEGVTVQKFVKL